MAMWTTSVDIPIANDATAYGVKVGNDVWIITDNSSSDSYEHAVVHVYNHDSLSITKRNIDFSDSFGSIYACKSHNKHIYVSASKYDFLTPSNQQEHHLFKLDTSTLKWEDILKLDEFFETFVVIGTNLFYYRYEGYLSIIMIDMEQKEEKRELTCDQTHTCCERNHFVSALASLDNQLYMIELCPETDIASVYNLQGNEFLRHQGDIKEILARLYTAKIERFNEEVGLNDFDDFRGGDVECTICSMNYLTNCYEEADVKNWCKPKDGEERFPVRPDSSKIFNNGLIHVIFQYEVDEKFIMKTIDCKPSLSTICYRDMVESIVWKQQELEDVLKNVPFPDRNHFKNMLKWKEEQRDAYGEEQRVKEEV